jgi:Sec7-like guanine-nucleotide exchange factor
MNRGINNGGDIPKELLISLFNSIQAEPFKIPEDDGNDLMHTFFNPDKEGSNRVILFYESSVRPKSKNPSASALLAYYLKIQNSDTYSNLDNS